MSRLRSMRTWRGVTGPVLAFALLATGPSAVEARSEASPALLWQDQTPAQDSIPGPQADTIDVVPEPDGQEPDPDPQDPAAVGDTLEAEPLDSLGAMILDSLGDTLQAEPEFRVRNLPDFPAGSPTGWATGVWEWDQERLRATRALNLLELLEEVPGVVLLRGGDYGQPASATAFGAGGGRIRIFWDGIEVAPVDGAAVDLARVGIAGLESVRVERRPGGLRIHLHPFSFSDPRPYSFLEVGTGDLETNLFRGVFAHPDALGGSVVLALDRLDTGGTLRQEPGVSFGAQIRHTLFFSERFGVAWEFRRMTSHRPVELWDPNGIQRSDWGARARYELSPGIVAGLSYHRASVAPDSEEESSGDGDSEALLPDEPRSQAVARVSIEREDWWGEGEYRQHWGEGWPSSVQALRAGGALPGVGGVTVSAERQAWDEESPISLHGRAWTRPFLGFSLFAEVEDGRTGVPLRILPDPEEDNEEEQEPPPELPPPSFSERTGLRAGVEYRNGDLFIGGAFLSVEADSVHPTGLPMDRDAASTGGGSRTGFEGSVQLPLHRVLNGLSLAGSAQFWEDAGFWPYLPQRSYEGRITFHDVFLEAENLEVWADVGVSGRNEMSVPPGSVGTAEGLSTAPFYQSWFGRLQIRVASVRAFVRWDNFTLRPENQDFPGRILPQTRALYGIRWTMWN